MEEKSNARISASFLAALESGTMAKPSCKAKRSTQERGRGSSPKVSSRWSAVRTRPAAKSCWPTPVKSSTSLLSRL